VADQDERRDRESAQDEKCMRGPHERPQGASHTCGGCDQVFSAIGLSLHLRGVRRRILRRSLRSARTGGGS
jgi:hypothetical protein